MKNSLILTVLLFAVTACTSFLEPRSTSEYIPRDVASLDEMLLGEGYPRLDKNLNQMLSFLDDDVACSPMEGTISSYDQKKMMGYRAFFSWQPDLFEQSEISGLWSGSYWERYYTLILGVNAALDYVKDADGTYEERALLEAQAYALRGLYYFNLVNIFGEPYNHNKKALGVPLKLNSGMEEVDLPRNTVEEVYNQVLSDLTEAERLFLTVPKNLQYRPNLRVSLPMVQLLKSRVYLYMENWKEAAVYADRVIKDWNFGLQNLNMLKEIKGGLYYNFISQECPETIWVYGSTNDFGASYSMMTLTETATRFSWKIFTASPALLEGYITGDLRKAEYMAKDRDSVVCLIYGKYEMTTIGTGTVQGNKFGQAFRISEAYLNLAEAAAFDKDETTALWALNELRENRFTPETFEKVEGITGEVLISTIRQERRLELCFEVHRWFDLRRYGMPSFSRDWRPGTFVQTYTLQEKDKGYTLPIPEKVLNRNKRLEQNALASPR